MNEIRQMSIFDRLNEDQTAEQITAESDAPEKRPTIEKAFSNADQNGKKKMNNKTINELFGIKESFELPDKLMSVLMDKAEREKVFNEFLQYDFDFSHDCLRDYFQDEHAARSALKQDYTPDCLCDLISALMPETEQIIDICSGTGALTIGTGRNVYFQCEELSKMSIPVLLFNLAIRGMNATVLQKNVLDKTVEKAYKLTKSEQFSDIDIYSNFKEERAKVVISNPPYSLPWTPKQDKRFDGYTLAPKGAADYAFVLDGISRLTDDGTALYILPHGVLFRGKAEAEIRKQLINNNLIDAIIGVPDKLFLNTAIPVFVLVLKKNRQRKDILFIDASKHFEKGGKQNKMTAEHIEKIADTYWNRKTVDKFSHVATYEEIKDNDYNLNIPRYVDTFEREEIPPLSEITKEIINCRLESQKAEKELLNMLADIVGDEAYNAAKNDFIKYLTENDIVGNVMSEWMYLQELERKTDYLAKNANKTVKPILDICDFERAKRGKTYSAGTVYIQLSATDGTVRILTEDKELEEKYGAFIPKSEYIAARYLYYALDFEMPSFLACYQCGMNINPEIFKHLKITYYEDVRQQVELASMLDGIQSKYEAEKNEKEQWEGFKKIHMNGMFPSMERGTNEHFRLIRQPESE